MKTYEPHADEPAGELAANQPHSEMDEDSIISNYGNVGGGDSYCQVAL